MNEFALKDENVNLLIAEEGISATSTAKREGFKKMIAEALEDGMDLIVTKSVSRFA